MCSSSSQDPLLPANSCQKIPFLCDPVISRPGQALSELPILWLQPAGRLTDRCMKDRCKVKLRGRASKRALVWIPLAQTILVQGAADAQPGVPVSIEEPDPLRKTWQQMLLFLSIFLTLLCPRHSTEVESSRVPTTEPSPLARSASVKGAQNDISFSCKKMALVMHVGFVIHQQPCCPAIYRPLPSFCILLPYLQPFTFDFSELHLIMSVAQE